MNMISTIFRKLPPFRGKKRLTRLFSAQEIAGAKNFLVKGKYNCSYFLPNLKESLALDIYTDGIYEQETHNFLLQRLGKNAVFLDLGANIGSVTIPLCKRRPDIHSYCVEASPWIVDYLERNVAANNLKNVTIIHRALYVTDNEVFKFYSPHEQFGKGSLSPVFTKEGSEVLTMKVDTLIEKMNLAHVDLVKIDIEGFEYFAFKGAQKLLEGENAPDILFEFADWAENQAHGIKAGDAQEFLMACGYRISILHNNGSLTGVQSILSEGNYMLFASKKIARV